MNVEFLVLLGEISSFPMSVHFLLPILLGKEILYQLIWRFMTYLPYKAPFGILAVKVTRTSWLSRVSAQKSPNNLGHASV